MVLSYCPNPPSSTNSRVIRRILFERTNMEGAVKKGLDFAHLTFGWIDYMLFALLMCVSLAIGVFFGVFRKQTNTVDYFLGGKKMNYWPIAMSTLASHVSGLTLLGVPTEVYFYGSQYFAVIFTDIVTVLVTIYIFLPVFSKLQIPSAFGYLEVRFARPVRLFCSFLYVISVLMFVPLVVFVPALAFSQVTQFSLDIVTVVLCAICITYTAIGGLKAVVWTDTIQLTITFVGLFGVLGLGIHAAGGLSEILRISDEGGRLVFFNMDPSPFERNSFWIMTIGLSTHIISHISVHQGVVQRCLAVPRRRDAVMSIIIMGVGMAMLNFLSAFVGLLIYSFYYDCDPLSIKVINRKDQLFPYYVMEVAGHIPGLPGLFLAGLVSSALSTLSADLNTVSGSVYEDFIKPRIADGPKKEASGANIMKLLVVIFGLISAGLVFVVARLGTVFQMAISFKSLLDGPVLGLFVLGMMFPWVKARGAITGAVTAIAVMAWLIFTTQWYESQGMIPSGILPISVDGCSYPLNETIISAAPWPDYEAPLVYKISFMYYTVIGLICTLVFGVIGSLLFGETDTSKVDPDHLTPFIRRFFKKERQDGVNLTMTSLHSSN